MDSFRKAASAAYKQPEPSLITHTALLSVYSVLMDPTSWMDAPNFLSPAASILSVPSFFKESNFFLDSSRCFSMRRIRCTSSPVPT